jgi:hypothetical protein
LTEQINNEAERRLREFLRENQLPTRNSSTRSREPIQSTSTARDDQSVHSDFTEDLSVNDPVTTKIFIRRIDCLLNSVPIDQIEDKQTGLQI